MKDPAKPAAAKAADSTNDQVPSTFMGIQNRDGFDAILKVLKTHFAIVPVLDNLEVVAREILLALYLNHPKIEPFTKLESELELNAKDLGHDLLLSALHGLNLSNADQERRCFVGELNRRLNLREKEGAAS